MATHTFKVSLSMVDLSKLESDEDFRSEAQRLLPDFLVKAGEAAGEVAWDELQEGLRGISGIVLNSSAHDKEEFIREAGENFRRQASSQERRELEDEIICQLRKQKEQPQQGPA